MIGIELLGAQVAVALHLLAYDPHGGGLPADARDAPVCEGIVVPIIAAGADPEVSVAALTYAGETRGVLRRRGGYFDGRKVVFIGRERVWLARGTELCQVEMYRAPVAVPVAVTAVVRDPQVVAPPAGPSLPPAIAKGITRTSATEFRIDPGARDQILEAQATLLRGVRLAPDTQDGKALGYRVMGVRPGSILGAIGIADGDRISAINGFDLTDPQHALEAYARLRTAPRLTLTVVRGGKSVNLDYEFR